MIDVAAIGHGRPSLLLEFTGVVFAGLSLYVKVDFGNRFATSFSPVVIATFVLNPPGFAPGIGDNHHRRRRPLIVVYSNTNSTVASVDWSQPPSVAIPGSSSASTSIVPFSVLGSLGSDIVVGDNNLRAVGRSTSLARSRRRRGPPLAGASRERLARLLGTLCDSFVIGDDHHWSPTSTAPTIASAIVLNRYCTSKPPRRSAM